MRHKKLITLLDSNRKEYKVEEQVQLEVELKNIRKIVIKVYEINLRKYYLEGQTSIDDQVDLSFLIPTHQQVYEHVPATPFQLCKTNIVLDKVPAKLGLFVVDLEGEGVVSRAVIRKGQIACVDSLTEAGQRLSFYDATGRPLGIANNLQLWVRGKPIPLS